MSNPCLQLPSPCLEEPFVGQIFDEVEIDVSDGSLKFSLFKSRNNEADCIAWVDNFESMVSDEYLHLLCDHDLCSFTGGNWDGRWESLPNGTYIVNPGSAGISVDQSLFNGHYAEPGRPDQIEAATPAHHLTGFPRFWELLGFVLPRRTRVRVYTPAYNDLLADYLATREYRFQTTWTRRYLRFCFAFHTVVLILQCFGLAVRSSALLMLIWLLPPAIRDWAREAWHSLFR